MGVLLPEPARDSPVAGLCRPAGRNAALYAAMGFFPAQQPPGAFVSAQNLLQSVCTNRCTFPPCSDGAHSKLASPMIGSQEHRGQKAGDLRGCLDSQEFSEQAAYNGLRCSSGCYLTSFVAGREQRLCIRVWLEDMLPPR